MPQNELFKFQLYLSAIEGTPPSAPPEGYKADTASHASFDDDNFSIDSSGGAAVSWGSFKQVTICAGCLTLLIRHFFIFSSQYGVLETSGTPPPGARAEAADADSFDEFSDEDESSTDPAVAAAAATASPARAQTGGSSLARVESPVVATAAAPAVPKAQMLYAFAGTNPGELAAEEGDEVEILLDDDSGWVHARKGAVEGYVPRSYLNL